MSRVGMLAVVAALALGACRKDGGGADGKDAAKPGEMVAVTGVITAVDERKVQVKTDDGRQLALNLNKTTSVTLAGGQAETAVITEGAPVRVSYRPQGSGGDLVTIDVEPQATNGRGETKEPSPPEPPADASRARQGR
jgi:ABC-type Fe3+-hydroxamate transport system substrate-binding protein